MRYQISKITVTNHHYLRMYSGMRIGAANSALLSYIISHIHENVNSNFSFAIDIFSFLCYTIYNQVIIWRQKSAPALQTPRRTM